MCVNMNDLFNITCSHLKLIPGFAISYLEVRCMFSPDYEVIVVAVDLTTQPVFYYLPLLFGDCTVKKIHICGFVQSRATIFVLSDPSVLYGMPSRCWLRCSWQIAGDLGAPWEVANEGDKQKNTLG